MNKLKLKSHQRIRSKKHKVFTEEVNKVHWVLLMTKNIINEFNENVWIWNKKGSSNFDCVTKEIVKEINPN